MSKKIAKELNEAIIDAVMNDKWGKFRTYCKKYSLAIPKKKRIMKASVYKVAQYRTNISDEVKQVALEKYVKLGFNPYIDLITIFP